MLNIRNRERRLFKAESKLDDVNERSDRSNYNFRLRGWFVLTTLILVSLIIIVTGCGKRGSLNPLEPPEIFITSYEGVEDSTAISDKPYFFQKRIQWRGESRGGTVEGYAYRVLDFDRQPIQTPKTLIDEDGWIYHYRPGADQSIPLTNPDVRTIWTKKTHDVINFPADTLNVVSIFQIKCKDNYDQESPILERYFNVTGMQPGVDILFSNRFFPLAAAEIDSFKTVGLGFEAQFEFREFTPYTPSVPHYFQFRIERRDVATGELIPNSQKPEDGGWFHTRNQKNVSRIWLAMEDDDPADFPGRDDVWFVLTPDEFGGGHPLKDPQTETLLIFNGVSLGGIPSQTRTAKFRVYEHFRPSALIYKRRIFVLGDNHFTTFQDGTILRPLPEQISTTPGEGVQLGTPFFVNKDGQFSALKSDDIKIYLRWGWKGQFENNNPDLAFINSVFYHIEGEQDPNYDYLAEIKAFDLRLDGEAYYYPPLSEHPEYETRYRYVDDDGTEWLRVPRFHEIDTRVLLTGVTPGQHHFQVRVLDSQNRTSEVEDFVFHIKEQVPKNEKSGILIVNNENYEGGFAYLNEETDIFYNYITENYSGTVETLDRRWLRNNVWDSSLQFNRNVIAPSDLETFRLVIWHCDNPVNVGPSSTNFHEDFDTLNLYMRGGGNVLISAGQNLRNIHTEARGQGFRNFILERYFGIPYDEADAIRRVTSAWFPAQPHFLGADKAAGSPLNVPDLDLNFDFHPMVNTQGGLGPVAYFDLDLIPQHNNVIPLYTMRASENGAQFDGVPVAVRRVTDLNTTYLFGFPLSYMDRDQVKQLMTLIFNDLGL